MDQLEFIIHSLPNLLFGYPTARPGGLVLSLLLGVSGVVCGFVLALPIGVLGASQRRWLRGAATLYIRIIRGLPLVLLLLIIHTIGSRAVIGVNFAPLTSAAIALLLYASAYQAEIIRGGLRAVPPTQLEAAQASGLGYLDAWRFVILPQALRAMLPAFAGQAIAIFKDTSFVMILGVGDLMMVGRTIGNAGNEQYFLALYGTIGLLYFSVAYTMSQLARPFERKLTAARRLWLTYESA